MADYRMPGMDGVRFLEAVGRVAPGVPRVLFTGHADEAQLLAAGAAEWVLPKSATLEELVEGIHGLLGSAPTSPSPRTDPPEPLPHGSGRETI